MVSSALRYTGEQTDDDTGLVYLRARWYDPATGRFTTRDPFRGLAGYPQTQHTLSRNTFAPADFLTGATCFFARGRQQMGQGTKLGAGLQRTLNRTSGLKRIFYSRRGCPFPSCAMTNNKTKPEATSASGFCSSWVAPPRPVADRRANSCEINQLRCKSQLDKRQSKHRR